MASNFEECQQFFKTLSETQKNRADYGSENPTALDRQITKLQARIKQLGGGKKKPPSKAKGGGSKPKVRSGYYTTQEYHALTPEEKDQVRKMRENAKKRKAALCTCYDDEKTK